MKSCFMFGHRDCPDNIMPHIESTVKDQYIKHGITTFYIGNRGRFDNLAAAAVKRLKLQYPDIYLYLLLAYHPGERAVNLMDGFDGTYYPPLENVPRKFAIVRSNKYMVDTADSIICFVKRIGNTRNLLEYAQRQQRIKEIIIENIAEKF